MIEATIQKMIDEAVSAAEQRILEQLRQQPDRTMDIREAAGHLGVSDKLLYRLCQEKSIPHERYGVKGSRRPIIKFRLIDLEAWRAQQRQNNFTTIQ